MQQYLTKNFIRKSKNNKKSVQSFRSANSEKSAKKSMKYIVKPQKWNKKS